MPSIGCALIVIDHRIGHGGIDKWCSWRLIKFTCAEKRGQDSRHLPQRNNNILSERKNVILFVRRELEINPALTPNTTAIRQIRNVEIIIGPQTLYNVRTLNNIFFLSYTTVLAQTANRWPEGGNISPLLVLLFVNDLNNMFRFCKYSNFTDDLNVCTQQLVSLKTLKGCKTILFILRIIGE